MSFLSTNAEFHASSIGLGVGLYSGLVNDRRPLTALVAISLGLDDVSSADDIVLSLPLSGHLIDCQREPAYVFGGLLVGYIAGRLAQ